MTPFDVTSRLFNRESFRNTSFADKMDLYFQDFSMIPLMVQENYIKMQPAFAAEAGLSGKKATSKTLELLSLAADSMSRGNLVEACAQR
jgi:replication factor C subunit 1